MHTHPRQGPDLSQVMYVYHALSDRWYQMTSMSSFQPTFLMTLQMQSVHQILQAPPETEL